ncbi:MAG: response regulator [Deltaproteobacteria bacterium]|nr:response regulator [Deltaproteobacteria bacterium]
MAQELYTDLLVLVPSRHTGPTASILVVDDDFDIREVLCEILTSEGYRVVDAANGSDALSRLRGDGPPSLVLLDLRMPVMDGYEFLKRRDADPVLRGIPVIVLSATDVMAAADLRAAHPEIRSLRKPINLGLLFDLIRHEMVAGRKNESRDKADRAAACGIKRP